MSNTKLTTTKLLSMYETMLKIRKFEEALTTLSKERKVPRTVHQSIGQEAIAAGVCSALEQKDYVLGGHRAHGQYIAKGGSLEKLMAEIFGKKDGLNLGRAGTMRYSDADIGFIYTSGVVGSVVPIAVGTALSSKLANDGKVTACFFGDGAANTGAVLESLNLAALWSLPLVFVCENNGYAMTTPYCRAYPIEKISDRALAFGMAASTIDGMDVISVYNSAKKAIELARKGKGPTFLEFKTYRFAGHHTNDHERYRSKDEVEQWKLKDPLKAIYKYLLNHVSGVELQKLEEKVETAVNDAVRFAEKSETPSEAFYANSNFG
jgi:TPP-dependent pyruvate/acetoin dehydrogenase alpha subunit